MPFDLYGNSYATRQEALNAETAQMAAIDADIAYREVQNMKRQMQQQTQHPNPFEDYLSQLETRIQSLEERLAKLEGLNP